MNKIVTILLSGMLMLLSVTLNASTFDDMTYNSVTSPNTWTDPGHGTFASGGNFSFRFKNANVYPPWVNGSAPNIKVGCNGISISGGFLSLLGLNDIEDQLKDAGAAFAWGVVMTIKATLPIVSQVFEAIQHWARTIQNLLQNACQLGQRVGRESGISGALSVSQDAAILDGFETAKEVTGNIESARQGIDDWVNGSTPAGAPTDADKGKVVTNTLEKAIKGGATVSIASSIFAKHLKGSISKTDTHTSLDDMLGGKDPFTKNASGDGWKQSVLRYKLGRLIFGELVTNQAAFKDFLSHIDASGTIDNEAIKKFMKAKISSPQVFMDKIGSSQYQGPVLSATDAVTGLLKGFSSISANSACSGGSCTIPNNKVDVITLKQDGGSEVHFIALYDTLATGSSSHLSLSWQGFETESLKSINNYVSSKVTAISGSFTPFGANTAGTTAGTAPLMMSGITDYLDTIVKLDANNGGNGTSLTFGLKMLLAEANAYYSAKQIAMAAKSLLLQKFGDGDVSSGSDDAKAKEGLESFITKMSVELNKNIDERVRSLQYSRLIADTFKSINESLEIESQKRMY